MNDLDVGPTSPRTFLYGCVLEAGKEVLFNPDDDDFAHQLDLRMACVDPSTKDELHMVEVEGQDAEGQKVKAVLASLKPSTLPSVCLGGFWLAPPTVLRLKAGSGPVHISGQHLIALEDDDSFDEDSDGEEEEEEEAVTTSKKRPAQSPTAKPQKKMKIEMGGGGDDDDDDEEVEEDDDDDEEEDDDDEEEEEMQEEPTPVKASTCSVECRWVQRNATLVTAHYLLQAKQKPSKPQTPAQNGKRSKPSTPAQKQEKTPKGKGAKSPQLPVPDIKTKLMEAMKKGISLPKVKPKFENLLKQSYKVTEAKDVAELWSWRQSMKESTQSP
ncbi:nucleophosmin 1a isoform X1 [Brachionichthys hirsutus]|uniref:nucleophosmin 1a isoform X1 n=1 Tax=Brachionichthys hirsutus TaxID=412623 RepID=UPI003604B201